MVMLSKLAYIALLLSTSVYAAPAGNATENAIEIAPLANEPANLVGWCQRDSFVTGVTNGQMFCEIQQNGQSVLSTYKYYIFNGDWEEPQCTSNNNLSVCVKMYKCYVLDSNGNEFVSQGCGGNMPCTTKPGANKPSETVTQCTEDFNKGIRI